MIVVNQLAEANVRINSLLATLDDVIATTKWHEQRNDKAERVCKAAKELSKLYDGNIDIIHDRLYEVWRELDDALARWEE